MRLQVQLRKALCMLHGESEVLLALISDHLVRMLRVASTLQELDAATFATQVCLERAPGCCTQ